MDKKKDNRTDDLQKDPFEEYLKIGKRHIQMINTTLNDTLNNTFRRKTTF